MLLQSTLAAASGGFEGVIFLGAASVAIAILGYTHESYSRSFTVMCAMGCAGAAVYGFLVGAWPLGIAMVAATYAAVRRLPRRKPFQPPDEPRALVRTLNRESRVSRLFLSN